MDVTGIKNARKVVREMKARELINCALVELGEQVRHGNVEEANGYLRQALITLDAEQEEKDQLKKALEEIISVSPGTGTTWADIPAWCKWRAKQALAISTKRGKDATDRTK